jgi:hypothetical protein
VYSGDDDDDEGEWGALSPPHNFVGSDIVLSSSPVAPPCAHSLLVIDPQTKEYISSARSRHPSHLSLRHS